jgi:hypothetical protein
MPSRTRTRPVYSARPSGLVSEGVVSVCAHRQSLPLSLFWQAGPKVAAQTQIFPASQLETPDPTTLEKEPPVFVPGYLKNPEFFYAYSNDVPDAPPPVTIQLSNTATELPTAPASSAAAPLPVAPTPPPAASTATAAAVAPSSGGGALQVQMLAHLMQECTDLRSKVTALEARASKASCVDVHIETSKGQPRTKFIGVPGNATLQTILDDVPTPARVAAAGKVVLFADQDQGRLIMTQTCGELRQHLMPGALSTDPLVLYLGLLPHTVE